MIRAILLALVFLILLIVWAARTPLSSHLLDDRVMAAWRRATGLSLDFRDATYHLADGRLELAHVTILDAETGHALTEIERVRLGWRWRLAAFSLDIDSIEIASPTPFILHVHPDARIAPAPRLQSFLDLFDRLSSRPSPRSVPGKVKKTQTIQIAIKQSALYLDAILPEGGSRRQAGVQALDIDLRYDPAGAWTLRLDGRLWEDANTSDTTNAPRLSATLEPRLRIDPAAGEAQYSFSLKTDALDTRRNYRRDLPFSLSALGLEAEGVAGVAPSKNIALDIKRLEAGDLRIAIPNASAQPPKSDIKILNLHARLDPTSKTITLEAVDIELEDLDSRLHASGRLALDGSSGFTCRVTDATLSLAALEAIQAYLPADLHPIRLTAGVLHPDLEFSGDRRGLDWNACKGNLRGDNLRARLPWLSLPIGPVALEAALSSRTLDLSKLDIQAGPHRLTIFSAHLARLDQDWRQRLDARANWTLDLDGGQVKPYCPPELLALFEEWKLKGWLRGHGSIRGEWNPILNAETTRSLTLIDRFEAALKTLDIDGTLRFKDARAYHPLLPAPIDQFSGAVVLTNDTAQFDDLQGEMLGSKTNIDCRVQGKNLFWTDPQVALRVRADIDLSRAREILDAEAGAWLDAGRREFFQRLHPQGRLGADLTLAGPLLSPTRFDVSGKINARDLAIDMDSEAMRGLLTIANARIALKPDRVTLERIEGRLHSVDLATSGVLLADHCELRYTALGVLPDYKVAFPRLFDDSGPVAGPARVTGWARAALTPDSALRSVNNSPLALFLDARRSTSTATSRFTPDWFSNRFDWDFQAAIDARDCMYTHSYMPVAADHIVGRLLLDRRGLHTDGYIQTRWGATGDGLTSVSIREIPALPPERSAGARVTPWKTKQMKIVFDAKFPEFHVDEWTQDWGPKDARSAEESKSRPPDRPVVFDIRKKDLYPMHLEVDGTISTDRVLYRKFTLENASTRMTTRVYRHHPPLFELHDLRGDIYKGKINTDLAFRFRPGALYWNWALDLENVQVEKIIEAHYGVQPSINGALSGHLDIEAVETNRQTYNGRGAVRLANSRFLGNPVFMALGKMPGMQSLDDISFTQMDGDFVIDKGTIRIPRLIMDGVMTDFSAQGASDFDGGIDLVVIYQPLRAVEKIPILNWFHRLSSAASDKILSVKVQGTLKKPKTTMFNYWKEAPPPRRAHNHFPRATGCCRPRLRPFFPTNPQTFKS